jgi:hypothetical protein
MDGIKWIFFDMGSTLIDESRVTEESGRFPEMKRRRI